MKYFHAIAAIILLVTVITVVALWPEASPPESSVAVTINGHPLYKNALTGKGNQVRYHSKDFPSLLHSAITEELLIQEAQRLRIDKEEDFRSSLQAFYEQSLIKTLLDRKYNELKIQVHDSEVDHYISLFGKKVTFSRLPVTPTPPYTPAALDGEQTEILFDDLAESLQVVLAGLAPGEYALKFDTGSERYAIRLDKVSAETASRANLPERQHLRNALEDYQRQHLMNKWLDELRESASITIHNR